MKIEEHPLVKSRKLARRIENIIRKQKLHVYEYKSLPFEYDIGKKSFDIQIHLDFNKKEIIVYSKNMLELLEELEKEIEEIKDCKVLAMFEFE